MYKYIKPKLRDTHRKTGKKVYMEPNYCDTPFKRKSGKMSTALIDCFYHCFPSCLGSTVHYTVGWSVEMNSI